MTQATRTQYRATCPVCFKQHALLGSRLVDHGYTIPQNWHARNGSCTGYGEAHFGTPEGLAVTKTVKGNYEEYLAREEGALAKLLSGKVKWILGSNTFDRKAEAVKLTKADGHWYAEAIKAATFKCEANIRGVKGDIETLGKLIAEWKPAEPVAVEVETGPTLHMYWERSREKVLCVYSSQRARFTHRHSTKVQSEVNCAACLKALAAMEAEKVVEERAALIVAAMVEKFGEGVKRAYSDANGKAISEVRYRMKHEDKAVRKEACSMLERARFG